MKGSCSSNVWKIVLNTNPIDCNGLSTIKGKDVIWIDDPKILANKNRNKPRCQSDRLYDGGWALIESELCDTICDFR